MTKGHLFDSEGHLFEVEGHLFDREGHLFDKQGHLFWEDLQFCYKLLGGQNFDHVYEPCRQNSDRVGGILKKRFFPNIDVL